MPVGLTMMYYNIRTRVEGLDLALAAVDKPDPRPSDVVSPEPEYGWLTGRDLVNIVILTGLFVLIICGLAMLVGSLVSVQ
ncbi:MAG: hypothetical protein EHM39_11055 [Chloroflexi bacterium]|nr:MAG: hypothetical protein EHM39_11055 [Chloroflexota bacterium]